MYMSLKSSVVSYGLGLLKIHCFRSSLLLKWTIKITHFYIFTIKCNFRIYNLYLSAFQIVASDECYMAVKSQPTHMPISGRTQVTMHSHCCAVVYCYFNKGYADSSHVKYIVEVITIIRCNGYPD